VSRPRDLGSKCSKLQVGLRPSNQLADLVQYAKLIFVSATFYFLNRVTPNAVVSLDTHIH
jgi:hypothetical protein